MAVDEISAAELYESDDSRSLDVVPKLDLLDIQEDSVVIRSFNSLCQESKDAVEKILRETGLSSGLEVGSFDSLKLPRQVDTGDKQYNLAEMLGSIVDFDRRKSLTPKVMKNYPHRIDCN